MAIRPKTDPLFIRVLLVPTYILIFTIFAVSVLILTFVYPVPVPTHRLSIPSQYKPIFVVDKNFLSFGIDAIELSHGIDHVGLDSEDLLQLTTQLSPARLRIGGTMSDRLFFVNNPVDNWLFKNHYASEWTPENFPEDKFLPYFTIDGIDLMKIIVFAIKTKTRILFDFNALLRNGADWDPTNAIEILKFTNSHNLTSAIDWQLGNEPNSFRHVFNESVSPQQLSRDFVALKKILKEMAPESLLAGPDTTRPQPHRPECLEYMKEFLSSVNTTNDMVDVVSWHQYYLNSRTATVDDFWDVEVYDLLRDQIKTMKENTAFIGDTPMWLSETSSSYGGGTPGLSNGFSSSPMWLDKLGLAASMGISVVVRQSLIGANYSLIDRDFKPLPDWWVSYFYKRLVGTRVISCNLNDTIYQRFYCHCASDEESYSDITSIAIFGINVENFTVRIMISDLIKKRRFQIEEYVLTSDDRMSKNIYLNGELLEYQTKMHTPMPRMKVDDVLEMPKYSLGFWMLRDVYMPACN